MALFIKIVLNFVRKYEAVFVAGFVTGVVLLVFYPALKLDQELMIGQDYTRHSYQIYSFVHNAFKSGQFPFWNPLIVNGMPFWETPRNQLYYPLNWLFVINPGNPTYQIYTAIHLIIAMLSMYWLIRKIFRLNFFPAVSSAIAFGLSSYFASQMWAGHHDMAASVSWLPFFYGHVYQLVLKKQPVSRQVLLKAVLSSLLIYLAGYQSMALYAYEAAGIMVAIHCLLKKNLWPLINFSLVMAVTVGLAAIQLVPSQFYLRETTRTETIPYEWVGAGHLQRQHFPEFIFPFIFGDQNSFFGTWHWYHERSLFFGKVTFVFFISAVVWYLLRRKNLLIVGPLIITCVFALWISLGKEIKPDLFNFFWDRIPFYHMLRMPSRHMLLFTFAACALAAFGMNLVKKRILQTALIGLLLWEMTGFFRHFINPIAAPETRQDQDLLAVISANNNFRFLPNYHIVSTPMYSFDFNMALIYGIRTVNAYEPAMLGKYFAFMDAVNGKIGSSLTENDSQAPVISDFASPYVPMLGAKYIMVDSGNDQVANSGISRFQLILDKPERGYRLYEDPAAYARYYFVPEALVVESVAEVASLISEKRFDPGKTILLARPDVPDGIKITYACQSEASPKISEVSYLLNRVKLKTETACDGFLASSDTFYPSWAATIDGVYTPVFPGNLAFRTIVLPKGLHEVEFIYVPKTVYLGLMISLLTGMLLAVFFRLQNR
jgi:hypothetical protein